MPNKINKWYMSDTDYDDVIVSSRVRMARNFSDFLFQERLSDADAEKLVAKVTALAPELETAEKTVFYSCSLSKLSDKEKLALAEVHSISPELAATTHPAGIILSEDESISIMINEEDHLHIQAVTSGKDLYTAFRNANRIDDFIDSRLSYAYSDKYGYLTSCMTDVGTGMRASYILSLPALAVAGKLRPLQDEVTKFGIAIKGLGGEGVKSQGFLYQISSRKTLGCSEQDILENLDQITGQIVALERSRRTEWAEKEHLELEDKIYRSYGVLKYTRCLNLRDALLLLSQVKLGADLGMLKLAGSGSDINRLMMEIHPGILQLAAGKTLDPRQCDCARAEYINGHLPELAGN